MSARGLAKAVFETYAADYSDTNALAKTQARLATWQAMNFGAVPLWQPVLGAAEEVGELSHAVLKRAQGIRGMDDEAAFREAAADAIADAAIFLMQASTLLRLDFETLVGATAEDVMNRNWIATASARGEGEK